MSIDNKIMSLEKTDLSQKSTDESVPESDSISLISNKSHSNVASVGDSFNEIFALLSDEVKKNQSTALNYNEFEKTKKEIDQLPMLDSNLEVKLQKSGIKEHKLEDIVTIHDPIECKLPKLSKSQDAGSKWFHMKQPEITPELRRDLLIIKQRSALDPKRHYKKDKWEIPKFFQMGTIIEGNTDSGSSVLAKKQRGKNLVEEFLHDDKSNKYFKRKYSEIQKKKTSGGRSHYKKLKERRKKY